MRERIIESWLLAACDPAMHTVPPDAVLTPEELAAAFQTAQEHAVLGAALQSHAAWSATEDASLERPCAEVVRRFQAEHFRDVGMALGLRQVADRAIGALRAAGIACCVLKGQDFADRLYTSAALRPYRDVDLLVPEDAYDDADRALRKLEFVPHLPQRKYAASEYGQISYFSQGDERWSLELHWNLINSPAQRQRCSLTWNDLEFLPVETANGPRLLAPLSLLLLATVHACVGHRFDSLQQLCDIRQICRGTAGPVDVELLSAAMRRCRCETPVRWSLDLLARLFACAEARALAAGCHFSPRAKPHLGILGRRTVMQPRSVTSRLRRSWARLRLSNAA